MKMNHHPTPTSRKEQHQQHSSSSSSNSNSRSSEMASNLTRTRSKLHKLTKKNVIAEFTDVSEDISSSISKESELSPLSPVSEDSDGVVYSESFKDSQDPEITAEVAAESLEHALFQIMNSADVDRRSKKIVEAVVNIVLEDFKDLVEEKDMLSRVVAAKSRIVLCSFLLWIIFASVVFFMNTTRAVPFSEPPPT